MQDLLAPTVVEVDEIVIEYPKCSVCVDGKELDGLLALRFKENVLIATFQCIDQLAIGVRTIGCSDRSFEREVIYKSKKPIVFFNYPNQKPHSWAVLR